MSKSGAVPARRHTRSPDPTRWFARARLSSRISTARAGAWRRRAATPTMRGTPC